MVSHGKIRVGFATNPAGREAAVLNEILRGSSGIWPKRWSRNTKKAACPDGR